MESDARVILCPSVVFGAHLADKMQDEVLSAIRKIVKQPIKPSPGNESTRDEEEFRHLAPQVVLGGDVVLVGDDASVGVDEGGNGSSGAGRLMVRNFARDSHDQVTLPHASGSKGLLEPSTGGATGAALSSKLRDVESVVHGPDEGPHFAERRRTERIVRRMAKEHDVVVTGAAQHLIVEVPAGQDRSACSRRQVPELLAKSTSLGHGFIGRMVGIVKICLPIQS
jgi:hypothetical protein